VRRRNRPSMLACPKRKRFLKWKMAGEGWTGPFARLLRQPLGKYDFADLTRTVVRSLRRRAVDGCCDHCLQGESNSLLIGIRELMK
jgi:hypothetical protein